MTRGWLELTGLIAALLILLAGCGGPTESRMGRAQSRLDSDGGVAGTSTVLVPGAMNLFPANATGVGRTVSLTGNLDLGNPFFQSLGTNGRGCVSCHVASQGWTITPAGVQDRFQATQGQDPIFSLNDGSTTPLADVSSVSARRQAFSMLLTKGLIRVGIGVPDGAEFELVAVDDPYGYASAKELSLFRRPLPAANLTFLSAVMWDGRETFPGLSINQDLMHQANDASQGHAQKTDPLTDAQKDAIVAFETGLYFAQEVDSAAGQLDLAGGHGGAEALSQTQFYLGINDTLGADPTGAPFNPEAMTLFAAWAGLSGNGPNGARAAVARGQALFNRKPIDIKGVRGLNDALGQPSIRGTCTTCHNAPDVGDHSVALPLDLGMADASRRTPDLPLYTLRNKTTGETVQTTDPGRALITGKWRDLNRFKGPVLRGLAARPPYFHNGSAATLAEVVEFYDTRFTIGLTAQEKSDLVAFLRSL